MARSKNGGGGRNSKGSVAASRRVGSQREQREEALATGFTPVAACDALFPSPPPYVLCSFRKTSLFPTPGIGMRLSRETGFPPLNPPTSFLASFPASPPVTGLLFRHLSACERSSKWCTPLGCRIYRRHVTKGRVASTAWTKRFSRID